MVLPDESWGVENGVVALVILGCASAVRLMNSSIIIVFWLVALEILTKHCKMCFLDYESLEFGEGGKGSALLIDVDQLMAPHPSLCLCPWQEAEGAFETMSHLGLVKAATGGIPLADLNYLRAFRPSPHL